MVKIMKIINNKEIKIIKIIKVIKIISNIDFSASMRSRRSCYYCSVHVCAVRL